MTMFGFFGCTIVAFCRVTTSGSMRPKMNSEHKACGNFEGIRSQDKNINALQSRGYVVFSSQLPPWAGGILWLSVSKIDAIDVDLLADRSGRRQNRQPDELARLREIYRHRTTENRSPALAPTQQVVTSAHSNRSLDRFLYLS